MSQGKVLGVRGGVPGDTSVSLRTPEREPVHRFRRSAAVRPKMTCWVPVPDDSDFPLENLALGVFSTPTVSPRVGIAIGDSILDCHALTRDGLLDSAYLLGDTSNINGHLGLGADAWASCRSVIIALLSSNSELASSPVDAAARYLVSRTAPDTQVTFLRRQA